MRDERFRDWSRCLTRRGQRQLADTVRLLIYRTAPDLFARMPFQDDAAFLDPLLFAWLTASDPPMSLEQTVDDARAGRPIRIRTALSADGAAIELFSGRHPLLDRFFVEEGGNPDAMQVAEVANDHVGHLRTAFQLMVRHCPDMAADIAATTRRVMLFRAPAPNSFATLSAHGAVFFNVPEGADEVFFLEDIAHQCAHVMFNALTLDKRRFLAVDPAMPLAVITGDPAEPRKLYSAFHALYTYTLICRLLATLCQRPVFAGRQAHELLGRLGYTLSKFGWDLDLLGKPDLYTARGHLCYRRFAAQYRHHVAHWGPLVGRLDFANQPYNFSYERFAASNPPAMALFQTA